MDLNAVENIKKSALSSLRNSAASPAFMSSKRNASELYRRTDCKIPEYETGAKQGMAKKWKRCEGIGEIPRSRNDIGQMKQ